MFNCIASILFAGLLPLLGSAQQQNGAPTPQQPHPQLDELHQSLNKFLYQFHGNTPPQMDKDEQHQDVQSPGQTSPAQHHPLLLPNHHKPLSPLSLSPPLSAPSHPLLFPTSSSNSNNGLLLPTPAHLPSTFRLPAQPMAQHKAFPMEGPQLPMEGPPPHHQQPVFSSIVEESRREREDEEPPAPPPLAMPVLAVEESSNETTTVAPTDATEATASSSASQSTSASTAASSPAPASSEHQRQIVLLNGANGTSSVLDLEGFLRSANLSEQDTTLFRALVERVLEEEVARRLEKTLNNSEKAERKRPSSITVHADGRQIVLELPEEAPPRKPSEQEVQDEADNRHELKTVNTRLFSLASGEEPDAENPQQQQRGVLIANAKGDGGDAPSGNHRTGVTLSADDYKQREQADFDRLLERLRESEAPSATTDERDADLLLVVPPKGNGTPKVPLWGGTSATSSTSAAATSPTVVLPTTTAQTLASAQQQTPQDNTSSGMLMRQHKFWSRHGPKNKFEHLVEDYRFRLSGQNGQNGLNDLIKALRNANIGFFDRSTNPNALKILRRID